MNIYLINGSLVIIDFGKTQEDDIEEIIQDFQDCVAMGTIWNCGNWLKLTATYNGQFISHINTRNIIAYS